MIKDYKKVLKHFNDLDAKKRSEKFLEKFWLSLQELNDFWLPIKDKIFYSDSEDLPDLMFKEGYELMAQRGGILFTKEEYHALQNCMRIAGDKYFVFIENKLSRIEESDLPHLRFKFPVETTWDMLNNGDEDFPDISFDILFIMNKHFFVFGDSGKWGKYAASNYYDTPLDIIGFKPEISAVFIESFNQSVQEQKEIKEWLPEDYKRIIQ